MLWIQWKVASLLRNIGFSLNFVIIHKSDFASHRDDNIYPIITKFGEIISRIGQVVNTFQMADFPSILWHSRFSILWDIAMMIFFHWSPKFIFSIWTKFGERICQIGQIADTFQVSNFPSMLWHSRFSSLWQTHRLSLNIKKILVISPSNRPWIIRRLNINQIFTTLSNHFTFMNRSLESTQRNRRSDPTEFYQRRIIVRSGSVDIVRLSATDRELISLKSHLRVQFIFIWIKFTFDTNWIGSILWLITSIHNDSNKCWNSWIKMFFKL
jgi:hypothetical protein